LKGIELPAAQAKEFFKSVRQGVRAEGGPLKRRDIKSTSVYFYQDSAGAIMLLDRDIVIVAGMGAAETRRIAKAVVTANT